MLGRRPLLLAAPLMAVAIITGVAARQVPTPTPSSTLAGTTIDGVTQTPIAQARVEARAPGGAPHRATSDEAGHFTIAGLSPGHYHVTASASGAFAGEFGQVAYGGPGRLVLAEANETTGDVVVPIWPAAAIHGRVADTSGAAVSARVVLLERGDDWDETWLPVRPDPLPTDENGRYGFDGLEPGRYAVLAWPPGAAGATSSFAPTFAPGATRVVDLGVIDVGPGARRDDASIDVRLRGVISIGGHLIGTPDQIGGATVRACPTDPGTRALGWCVGEAHSSADGSFRIAAVPAGNYALEAQRPRSDRPGVISWGRRAVSLGTSAENADIQMNAPFTLTGTAAAENRGDSVFGATVAVRAVDALLMSLDGRSRSDAVEATAGSDGRFAIDGLPPGEYLFSDRPGAGPWTLRSAIVGNRDAADEPVSLDEGVQPPTAAVTLTRARASVSGVVRASTGDVEADATVLLFSSESHLWLPQSRRIHVGHTGADGSFSFDSVPPGEYYVSAAAGSSSLRPTAAGLEAAVPMGRKIQVTAGAQAHIDLALPAR